MKSKKAEGLTLNTVVIAVLVLIVLGILIFIAYKYIWGTGRGIGELSSCQARTNNKGDPADCKTLSACQSSDGTAFYKMGGCPTQGKGSTETYCCIPKDR